MRFQRSGVAFLILGIGTGALLFFGRFSKTSLAGPGVPGRSPSVLKSSHDQNLEKFSLTGFNQHGEKFWRLLGDTAQIDLADTVYLKENVTLKLKDGTTVRTDRVRWSPQKDGLKTGSPVFVDHPQVKIQGRGAVAHPNDSFVQLNRDIEMIVNDHTRINCRGPMKIFYDQQKMIFYRNVRVVDARGVLTANRMDVFFHPKTRQVEHIVAVGDVVIERGTDTTHSHRAIYTLATGSVRLEGNPQITLHKGTQSLLDGAPGN